MTRKASWAKFCSGSVSRNTLLNRLLPLSFACCVCAIKTGAFCAKGQGPRDMELSISWILLGVIPMASMQFDHPLPKLKELMK